MALPDSYTYESLDAMKQRKVQLTLQRAELVKQLEEVKSRKPESNEESRADMEARQLRAGAEAMMPYDANTAYSWLEKADALDQRKAEKAQSQYEKSAMFIPGTKEWVNWMTGMLKQKTYEAGLYTGQARSNLLDESNNIKTSLSKYPLGRSALGIPEPGTTATPTTGVAQPTSGPKVKTAEEWRRDILAVSKNTPNWKAVLNKYRTDIATALTNKEIGDKEASTLVDQIGEQEKSIAKDISAPAFAEAGKKAEAKKWVSEFLGTMKLDDLIKQARAAHSALNSIISEVKAGHYANANLKPFKDVMGAMSAGEYGIASDSPTANMVQKIPFVGEGIAGWIATDKFNDEKTAYERTNAAIDSYNQLIGAFVEGNMIPAKYLNSYRIAALNDNAKAAGLRTALGSTINHIKAPGSAAGGTYTTVGGFTVTKRKP